MLFFFLLQDWRKNLLGNNNEISLSEAIYREIKKRITKGIYPGGTALTEAGLAEEFNTSKTPVKTAIGRLVTEGWLETGFRKKVYVKKITHKQIDDYYEVRELFERQAINKIFDTGVTWKFSFKLEEVLVRMRAHINDYYEFDAVDAVFHRTLISVFDNERILKIYSDLTDEFVRLNVLAYKHMSPMDENYFHTVTDQLYQFILAVRNNDREGAIEYMIHQHLLEGRDVLHDALDAEG